MVLEPEPQASVSTAFSSSPKLSRNISNTSASVLPCFPDTRKLMKARCRRPRAFIVFECLENPGKTRSTSF